jgi:hypothetical protein
VAKKTGITSGEALQLNKGVKGTSIGNGALKSRHHMNKHKTVDRLSKLYTQEQGKITMAKLPSLTC